MPRLAFQSGGCHQKQLDADAKADYNRTKGNSNKEQWVCKFSAYSVFLDPNVTEEAKQGTKNGVQARYFLVCFAAVKHVP